MSSQGEKKVKQVNIGPLLEALVATTIWFYAVRGLHLQGAYLPLGIAMLEMAAALASVSSKGLTDDELKLRFVDNSLVAINELEDRVDFALGTGLGQLTKRLASVVESLRTALQPEEFLRVQLCLTELAEDSENVAKETAANLIQSRIAVAKANEEARLKAERERIAAEENAKAEAAAAKNAAPLPHVGPAAVAVPVGTAKEVATITPLVIKGSPTDDQIISVIADHWRVHEMEAIKWLRGIDLDAAEVRASSEFVA